MIWYLVLSFIWISCNVLVIFRSAGHPLPVYRNFSFFSSTIFSIKHFSASTQGNDLIFGMQLYKDELYGVRDFQICRTSTSCLLKLGFLFIINISVKDLSAFTQGTLRECFVRYKSRMWTHISSSTFPLFEVLRGLASAGPCLTQSVF